MRVFPLVKGARAVGWCPSFIPLESWHWWRWWTAGTSTTNGGVLCLRPDPRADNPVVLDDDERAELERLRKENAELRLDRAFLKKPRPSSLPNRTGRDVPADRGAEGRVHRA